ncbi:hypothetical protein CSA56_09755 [candidate division KSB3 bacterium]|uniref:Uncharacterized protein n=1 Tax=candidate division KSB3 bacterium TaxID=2044937 RepID=A0A2G6KG58_9BACT|nr:MAG: hypothetical protein CSA56_09755 [candidate division KSB3 bacterium]
MFEIEFYEKQTYKMYDFGHALMTLLCKNALFALLSFIINHVSSFLRLCETIVYEKNVAFLGTLVAVGMAAGFLLARVPVDFPSST